MPVREGSKGSGAETAWEGKWDSPSSVSPDISPLLLILRFKNVVNQ